MQTTQSSGDIESRIQDVLLAGYMYGEEQRALAVATELRMRLDALRSGIPPSATERPRVMSMTRYAGKMYAAGRETIEGNVIELAGGINGAAAAGITGYPAVSMESIVAVHPQAIIVTQSGEGGERFRSDLLVDPALAGVPAIANNAVYVVGSKYFTTLSFWNLRGAESLASLLYPSTLGIDPSRPFTFEAPQATPGVAPCH